MRNDAITAEPALSWGVTRPKYNGPSRSQVTLQTEGVVGCWIDCRAPRPRREYPIRTADIVDTLAPNSVMLAFNSQMGAIGRLTHC